MPPSRPNRPHRHAELKGHGSPAGLAHQPVHSILHTTHYRQGPTFFIPKVATWRGCPEPERNLSPPSHPESDRRAPPGSCPGPRCIDLFTESTQSANYLTGQRVTPHQLLCCGACTAHPGHEVLARIGFRGGAQRAQHAWTMLPATLARSMRGAARASPRRMHGNPITPRPNASATVTPTGRPYVCCARTARCAGQWYAHGDTHPT